MAVAQSSRITPIHPAEHWALQESPCATVLVVGDQTVCLPQDRGLELHTAGEDRNGGETLCSQPGLHGNFVTVGAEHDGRR